MKYIFFQKILWLLNVLETASSSQEDATYEWTFGDKHHLMSLSPQLSTLKFQGFLRNVTLPTSLFKATNECPAKRKGTHATMTCYTFFERSWHAKCQSMSKIVKMGDPAYGGHAIGNRTLNLIIQWLRRSPIGICCKWADISPLLKYISGAVAPRLKAPKGPY